jgi:3-phenylpropionate/trans-cinnamate dioxygenase ferredoxin reductase component
MNRADDLPVVVAGASLAGVRFAQALREQGCRDRVVLIGGERELPYDRPPLSKHLLGVSDGPPLLVDAEELAALDVETRLGVLATSLDLEARAVSLDSGEEIGYSSLVVATGSAPLSPAEWRDMPGVYQLRTFDDCARLRAELLPGRRLAIVGAGFIGAEVASSARELGVDVVVLDNTAAPLVRALGPFVAETTRAMHQAAGVELHHEITVAGFEGDKRIRGVRLADGSFIEADAVLVCIGARPAVDWLVGSGLSLDNGVLCDASLTAAPDVYAIGDVSNFHNVLLGERMRVEHWTNAGEQANYVAKLIATGDPGLGFGSLPFVWSEQFGTRIEVVGRPRATDVVKVIEGSLEERQFVVVCERDGRDVAGVAFNASRSMLQLRRRLLAEFSDEQSRVAVAAS